MTIVDTKTVSDEMRAAAEAMSRQAPFNSQYEHDAVKALRAGAGHIERLERLLNSSMVYAPPPADPFQYDHERERLTP